MDNINDKGYSFNGYTGKLGKFVKLSTPTPPEFTRQGLKLNDYRPTTDSKSNIQIIIAPGGFTIYGSGDHKGNNRIEPEYEKNTYRTKIFYPKSHFELLYIIFFEYIYDW